MSANIQPLCNYIILKLMILALIMVSALILTVDWDFDDELLFLFKSSLLTYLIQLLLIPYCMQLPLLSHYQNY